MRSNMYRVCPRTERALTKSIALVCPRCGALNHDGAGGKPRKGLELLALASLSIFVTAGFASIYLAWVI